LEGRFSRYLCDLEIWNVQLAEIALIMVTFKHLTLLVIIVVVFVGAGLVFYATSSGIGTSPDSVAYIGSARNLAAGLSLTVPFGGLMDAPLIHHAAFYPTLLGMVGFSGIEPADAARGLGVVLMVANVLLAAWLVLDVLQDAIGPPLIVALLIAFSPIMLEIHSMAWTEPLFIFLGFLGLAFLARGLERRSWALCFASAMMVGLALMTRYAGIAFIATAGLGIFIMASGRVISRLVCALGFSLTAFLPMLLWSIQNLVNFGTASSRSLNFHPIGKSQLWQGMTTISSWLLVPEDASTFVHLTSLVFLGLVASAAMLYVWRNRWSNHLWPSNLLTFISIFIPVYGIFLLFSISFFDANTPLDGRILSPIYFAGVIFLVALFSLVVEINLNRQWISGLLLCFFLLVGGYGHASWQWAQIAYREGIGFSSSIWQRSPVLAELRSLSVETNVFTNAPEGVYYNGKRRALRLPVSYEAVRQQANPNYEVEIENMMQQLASGQGVVVFFTHVGRQTNPSEAELVEKLSLELFGNYPDGNIYVSSAEKD
jgi:hypothetical protein